VDITDSDLFCGDLLENTEIPVLNSIMDEPAAANISVEKLKSLKINTVYPGHGKPKIKKGGESHEGKGRNDEQGRNTGFSQQ
jgi:glyoxylase-like metal-dependent hydrolase (beta-lactamase superfamily II)